MWSMQALLTSCTADSSTEQAEIAERMVSRQDWKPLEGIAKVKHDARHL